MAKARQERITYHDPSIDADALSGVPAEGQVVLLNPNDLPFVRDQNLPTADIIVEEVNAKGDYKPHSETVLPFILHPDQTITPYPNPKFASEVADVVNRRQKGVLFYDPNTGISIRRTK